MIEKKSNRPTVTRTIHVDYIINQWMVWFFDISDFRGSREPRRYDVSPEKANHLIRAFEDAEHIEQRQTFATNVGVTMQWRVYEKEAA